MHRGKVFVLRSKYKSKPTTFCTKKGPNYGHVRKFKRKTLIKRSIQGFDFIWFGYWIYSILCESASANDQHTVLNLQLFKKSREKDKKLKSFGIVFLFILLIWRDFVKLFPIFYQSMSPSCSNTNTPKGSLADVQMAYFRWSSKKSTMWKLQKFTTVLPKNSWNQLYL